MGPMQTVVSCGLKRLADGCLGKRVPLSTYKLHFGNFGGLPVKLAYLMMRAPLTVVARSGMSIWLVKHHHRGRAGPRLGAHGRCFAPAGC